MRQAAHRRGILISAAIVIAAQLLACLHCLAPRPLHPTADAALAALGWSQGSAALCLGGAPSEDDGAPHRKGAGLCPACATLAGIGLAAGLAAAIIVRLSSGRPLAPQPLAAAARPSGVRIRAPPLAA